MFRILSLDGGGIKGAFTASVLAAIEDEIQEPIGEYFDLIAGTSTGGILALGLGFRIPAKEILKFYREEGPKIFPATGRLEFAGLFRQLFTTKYSYVPLRKALVHVLHDRKLRDSQSHLIIPMYDAIHGHTHLFKTAAHPDVLAVDVACATSAAPTYFASAPFEGSSFVDGGVWANSPVLVAVVEAISFLNGPVDQIDVLSIGTTATPFNIAKNRSAGIIKWNVGMINLMFEAQAEMALKQAGFLLKERVLRIDRLTEPGEFSLDDARPEKIDQLMKLGSDVAKENLEAVKTRFVKAPKAEPFKPQHGAHDPT
jgi:patatin-like phospholipase/acyl hydrolase